MAAKGFQSVTALNVVKTLTIPAGSRFARVQAQGQAVRYRLDGTDPTTTVGSRLAVGETIELSNDSGMTTAKFLEEAASGTLAVHYFD